jgi:hypothetical protein
MSMPTSNRQDAIEEAKEHSTCAAQIRRMYFDTGTDTGFEAAGTSYVNFISEQLTVIITASKCSKALVSS